MNVSNVSNLILNGPCYLYVFICHVMVKKTVIMHLLKLLNSFKRLLQYSSQLVTLSSMETLMKTQTKRSVCFHKFLQENNLATRQTEPTTIDFFLYKSAMNENVLDIQRKLNILAMFLTTIQSVWCF